MYKMQRFNTARRGRLTARLPATERIEAEMADCGHRVEPLIGEDDDADVIVRGRNPNMEPDLVEMICGSRY
jgi:hypothetical protein